MKYEIVGTPLPAVTCQLEANEAMITERGSMCWMSPNMKMDTNTGGGLKKMFGRMFSCESLFLNDYTAMGGNGMIAFAASFPGSIIPYQVTPGNGIIVQKRGFLAMEKGLELSVYFQKRLGKGFFGGEGFIMQRLSGSGTAFVEIDGALIEYELKPGQQIVVDSGCVAGFTPSVQMDIRQVPGLKNKFLGGEGLFNTLLTGPGTVWLQTMPLYGVASAIQPFLDLSSD